MPHIVPDNGNSDDDYNDNGDEGYGRPDDCKSDQFDDVYGDSDDDADRRGNATPTSKSAAVLSMDIVTKVQGRSSKETLQMVQKHGVF